MTASVTLLGVKGGPAIRPGSNMPTSVLLRIGDQTILVDAGLGVARSLCDAGVALTELDAIFVTHLHSDHYLELGPLLHTAWTAGLTRCVPIYGPAGLADYWRDFQTSMHADIALRIEDEGRVDFSGIATLSPLDNGWSTTLGPVTVSALRNDHPPITDSFALKFECAGTSIVLSGDTAYMDEMATFAHGADLLVHEAMLLEGIDQLVGQLPSKDSRLRDHILRSHTSAEDVGRIASRAKVGKLALYHLVPDGFPGITEADWSDAVRQTWAGPLVIGDDGTTITF